MNDKILNWLFRLIDGTNSVNWFSAAFSRWKHAKIDNYNLRFESGADEYLFFECPGAGKLSLSKQTDHLTGQVQGFDIGVSWGRYGYCGGVLGRTEARRLAAHILKECDRMDGIISEEDAVKEMYQRLKSN